MRKEGAERPLGFDDEACYVSLVQIFKENGKTYANFGAGVSEPSNGREPAFATLDKDGKYYPLHYKLTYPELLARERNLLASEIWPTVTRRAIRALDTLNAEKVHVQPPEGAGGVVVAFPVRG